MICIAIFSFLFILFTFSSYIYHFSELNPTCLYKFCLQALKDLSLSLSSFTLRFFTEIVQIDLNSYVWTPVHLSTGPGQYHLHAFCHLPAKWSNSFGLPEKNIILSLHVHQPLCWARLSFFLAHSSCYCQNLQPSSHHHPPFRPEQRIERLFSFKPIYRRLTKKRSTD